MSGHHFLVVGPYDEDDTGFAIEHPPDCPTEQCGDREFSWTEYTCGVGMHVSNAGIDAFFVHADDDSPGSDSAYLERVDEGRHPVEAWQTVRRGGPWGPDEWDGGLRLVEQPQERAS